MISLMKYNSGKFFPEFFFERPLLKNKSGSGKLFEKLFPSKNALKTLNKGGVI